jgi:signal transduction histidine kinase
LVKNAIQSIPEQQESKTVFVTVKGSNNVLIIVEDNGIGIKPEDISIFEPKFTTKTAAWD